MGSFLVKANIVDTMISITKFLSQNRVRDFECDREKSDESRIEIEAKSKIENFAVMFSSKLNQSDKDTLVEVQILPDTKLQKSLGLKILIFIGLSVFLYFVLFHKFLSSGELSSIEFIILIAFFLLAFRIIKDFRVWGTKLRDLESRCQNYIRKNHAVETLSPIEAQYFPLWFQLVESLAITVCGLFILFQFKILFVVFLPFALALLLHTWLRLIVKTDAILSWKIKLIEINFKWLIANMMIIIIFVFLYSINNVLFIAHANVVHKNSYSYKEGFLSLYFKPALDRDLTNSTHENVEMIKEIINEQVLRKTIDEKIGKYLILIVVFSFFGIIAIGLWLLLSSYKGILKISEYWRSTLAKAEIAPIKQPPISYVKNRKSKYIKSVVLADYVVTLPITYFAAIISIDTLSYALLEKTLIIKKSAIVFSWIPANFILLADTLNIKQLNFLLLIPKIILFLMALPILLMLIRRISELFVNVFSKTYDFLYNVHSKDVFSSKVIESVARISSVHKIPNPRLKVKNSRLIEVYTRMGIFSKSPSVVISKAGLYKLNEQELIAVIAHEMAHIQQGIKKLNLAKILSRVAMFPNYFLTLLFDFTEMEYEADEFCVRAIKNKKSLKEALIKISVFNYTTEGLIKNRFVLVLNSVLGKMRGRLKKLFLLDEFFFGDMFIGYAHPVLKNRIKRIDNY